MKKLLILSGKGGTGKTTVASAFIKLHNAKVYADCDVDAPNLHLVTNQGIKPKNSDYYGLPKAKIDNLLCVRCGICMQHCRFDAIYKAEVYKVNEYQCEGCGVCELVCPNKAVTLQPDIAGQLTLYDDSEVFSTAQLKMGRGTSGLLVSEVKKQITSPSIKTDLAIIDGSPGIGCPVIASIKGVDMVLVVAEPSVSGLSDIKRIIKTAEKFQVKTALCINKYDLNLEKSKEIERYCDKKQIFFAGRIPFDDKAVKVVNSGKNIVDCDGEAAEAIKDIFNSVYGRINGYKHTPNED
ncbi:ATP-binding protein [Proteinivorax hydrogeniformans]|uniref:ATP-binding protein n=1 Tax=Proteinivorax hydrogeniformans TaxID=1826727 RepID=A0AAU8HUQ0_9FIRM